MVAQDDTNLRAERGLSTFNEPHRLTLSYMISSPWGSRASGLRSDGFAGRMLADSIDLMDCAAVGNPKFVAFTIVAKPV